MRRILRQIAWAAVFATPFLLIAMLDLRFQEISTGDSTLGVAKASALKSDATRVSELPAAGWESVTLPHRFENDRVPTRVWYRFAVEVTNLDSRLWALYLPQPNADFSVFINGEFVGGGNGVSPIPMHSTPLFFRFPSTVLRTGRNDVALRSMRDSRWTTLQGLELGPEATLSGKYQRQYFIDVTLMQVIVACAVAMSLMMLLLFRMRSSDSVFGWFALALLFWSSNIVIKLVAQPPFEVPHLWINMRAVALGGYVISAMYFVHRFLGVSHSRVERIALAWGLAGAAVLIVDPLLFGYQLPWFFGVVWFPPLLFLAAFLSWQLVRAHSRSPTLETRLLAALGWMLLVVGVRDNLLQNHVIDGVQLYFPFTIGPTLIVLGFILMQRFASAVESVARARDALELRVAEKTAELERNLIRLKDLERDQALTIERERIMRDMHDGVGGQLVQALTIASSRSELKIIEEPLQNCLDELRLIIDSIEPVDGNLASVLGTLRLRMSRRLAAAGVHLGWNIADIPELTDFGPSRVLHVSRVVQEAIANALKHARARQITVRAYSAEASGRAVVAIEIEDDGVGIGDSAKGGRGLQNMHRRAIEAGGWLTVESLATGTRVKLGLYVESVTAEAPSAA